MAFKILKVDIQKIPKRAAGAIVRVNAALMLYGLDAQSEISRYPEQETPYIRSGELGRFWFTNKASGTGLRKPKMQGNDLVMRIGNKKPYAGRVQGKDQEELFKGFGWPNITSTNKIVWAKHKPFVVAAIKG